MCPQSNGAALNHQSIVITYSMNVKHDVTVLRQFYSVMLEYADHCCGFHAADVCLQKRSEGHDGFREESLVCSLVRKI